MKLKKLKINSHYHLKDLEFDFTYPAGHDKAGQPLEKICFIGQSATGKTKILNLIYDELVYLLNLKVNHKSETFIVDNYEKRLDGSSVLEFIDDLPFSDLKTSEIFSTNDLILYENISYELSDDGNEEDFSFLINTSDDKVIYFESNYITSENLKHFNTNPLELVFDDSKKDDEYILYDYRFKESQNDDYILKLLQSFLNFRQKYDQKIRELLLGGVISDLEKFNREFKEWQNENPNPIVSFSEKFDGLLKKLHLEIDKVSVDYPIPFRNKVTNEIIPIDGLSTGTKGLLLYMLPLYEIYTSRSIILLDEPERSLYPDIQMELIDFFRKVSPDSQIIIATHSPFIAASFEPEERFILYFNEDGKVEVRNGSSPIGDDPNDILSNDFGINYINKYGQKAYDEYKELKKKIYFEKDNTKKREYSERLEELGEKYNF